MKKFREMDGNQKENEKNLDKKSFLNCYKADFNAIISEADKLITNMKI